MPGSRVMPVADSFKTGTTGAGLYQHMNMSYHAYQLYQIERAKSPAEMRQADEQLGRMAKRVSMLWHSAARPGIAWRALLRHRGRRSRSAAAIDGRWAT